MRINRVTAYALLLVLVLLAGCDRQTEERTTALVPTLGEPQPANTPAGPALAPSSAASSVPATATVLPAAASTEPQATRIQFEPGAASATINGRISQLGVVRYVLSALEGQTMNVVITSPRRDVLLNVTGADGAVLKRYVDGKSGWQGALPSTQDYYLEAVSIGAATGFALRVTVPPLATTAEPQAQRLDFASGATTTTVAGRAAPYRADLYVLHGAEGQTLDAVLTSTAADVLLEIWGADGTTLKRYLDGETTWSGVLPATQDYFLEVISFGSEADYSLAVTISPQ